MDAYVCRTKEGGVGRIVMAEVEGTLAKYLLTHSFDQDQATRLLKVVQCLHQANVVHQDLHSENVGVRGADKTLQFYLFDFGESHQYGGNPFETSPRAVNFRHGGGGDTKDLAQVYDLESIISDLKDRFGIEISVTATIAGATKQIEPEALPGQVRKNQLALAKAVAAKVSTKEKPHEVYGLKKPGWSVDIPGRTVWMNLPEDTPLLDQQVVANLTKLSTLKFKIVLP
jgi:hypothetical protein